MGPRTRHDSVTDLRIQTVATLDRVTAVLEKVALDARAHREAAIAVQYKEDDPVELLTKSREAEARARLYAAEAELAGADSATRVAASRAAAVEAMAAHSLEAFADRIIERKGRAA
jgi:hypothetical protein